MPIKAVTYSFNCQVAASLKNNGGHISGIRLHRNEPGEIDRLAQQLARLSQSLSIDSDDN